MAKRTREEHEKSQAELRREQEAQEATDRATVLDCAKTLLSKMERCKFSCFVNHAKDDGGPVCALMLSFVNPVGREKHQSVYLGNAPRLYVKQGREWIYASANFAEGDEFVPRLGDFIRAAPVTVWMEFLLAIRKTSHLFPMPMRHTNEAELAHVGDDRLFRYGTWASLPGESVFATYSIVHFTCTTATYIGNVPYETGYYIAVCLTSGDYVYFPTSKAKARALCQVVQEQARSCAKFRACFSSADDKDAATVRQYIIDIDAFCDELENAKYGFSSK